MEGNEEINGQKSYITLEQAKDYMTVNVSVTGWDDTTPEDAEKENYILSAYQEINPDDITTIEEGKRTQLTLLAEIFMNKEAYYEAKGMRLNKVKSFSNSKLKMDFSGTSDSSASMESKGANGVINL